MLSVCKRGGYKPLAVAISAALIAGFSSSSLAVDIPTINWDEVASSSTYQWNAQASQYLNQVDPEMAAALSTNGGNSSLYVTTAEDTKGATTPSVFYAASKTKVSLGSGNTIYLYNPTAKRYQGYIDGMTTAVGGSEIVNNGTIYAKGSATAAGNTKAMSVNDGRAENLGTIAVEDAYGMVANSKNSNAISLLVNSETIIVKGDSAAGMVDNNPKPSTQDTIVNLKNSGHIEVESGTGILVQGDFLEPSKSQQTNINIVDGTITAQDGAQAIDVQVADHEVNIKIQGQDSAVDGWIKLAGSENMTDLEVSDASQQSVKLDAEYLREVNVSNSQLTVEANKQEHLTIDGLKLAQSGFELADNAGLNVTVNELIKDTNSSVDWGTGNSITFNQDWGTGVGESSSYDRLVVGSEAKAANYVNQGQVGANAIDVVNGKYSNLSEGNAVTTTNTANLTVRSQGDLENKGIVRVTGTSVFEKGASLENQRNDQNSAASGVFETQALKSAAALVNDAKFTVRGESTFSDSATFRNDANGEAAFSGPMTVEGGSTVYNNGGKLSLANVSGAGHVINGQGNLTFSSNAKVASDVENNDQLIFGAGAQISSVVTNKDSLSAQGDLTVAESGKVENSGNMTVAEDLFVSGEFNNAGVATVDGTTSVNGLFAFVNDGQLHGSVLDVAADSVYQNNGTAEWTSSDTENLATSTISGTADNTGSETFDKYVLSINGTQTNEGTQEMENATIEGHYDNYKQLVVNADLTVGGEATRVATLTNNGQVTGSNVSLLKGATINNEVSATFEADNMFVDGESTLRNEGTLTVSRAFHLLKDALFGNDGVFTSSESTSLSSGAVLSNHGEMSLKDITMNDQSQIRNELNANMTIEGDTVLHGEGEASIRNEGLLTWNSNSMSVDVYNSGSSAELVANQDVTLTAKLENSNSATFNAGLTFANGSTYVNQGTTSVDGLLTIRDGAIVTNSGQLSAEMVAGALDGQLTTKLTNITYEEIGADASFTVSGSEDFVQFENSTIRLKDGAVWNRDLGYYNTYELSSSFAKDLIDTGLSGNWREGFSRVETDNLVGINKFVLNQGGLLTADTIGQLTEGAITFNGGVLETSVGQVFDGMAYVDPVTGDTITNASQLGSLIAANTVDAIKDNIVNGVTIEENGGHLVFNDALYSEGLVQSVSQTLSSEGWDKIIAHYTGKVDTTVLTDDDWANHLMSGLAGDTVLSGIRLVANAQSNSHAGPFDVNKDGNLVMTGGTYGFGVGSVVETDRVILNDGADFTLVGFGENESMVGTDGSVDVNGGSKLTLGFGSGKLSEVMLTGGSKLAVQSGSYYIETLGVQGAGVNVASGVLQLDHLNLVSGSVTNAGVLAINENAVVDAFGSFRNTSNGVIAGNSLVVNRAGVDDGTYLNEGAAIWKSMVINGDATNSGTEQIDNYTLSGEQTNNGEQLIETITIGQNGIYTNTGKLLQNSAKAQMTMNGSFINQGDAYLGKVSGEGNFANQKTIQAASIDGQIVFNNASSAKTVVDGNVTLKSLENSGQFLIGENLTATTVNTSNLLQVEGSLTANEVLNSSSVAVNGNTDVGLFNNELGAAASLSGDVTADNFINQGEVQVGSLNADVLDNLAGKLTAVGDVESKLLTNNAQMVVGGNLITTERLVNTSEMHVNGNVSSTGHMVNSANAEATIVGGLTADDLSNQGSVLVGGDAHVKAALTNAANAEMTVVGSTTVGGVLSNEGTLSVAGDLTANESASNAGSMTVVGKLKVLFGLNNTDTVSAGSIEVAGLDNQKTVSVTEGASISGMSANSGDITVGGDIALADTFENTGKVSVAGNASISDTMTQSGENAVFEALGGENVINGQVAVSDGSFTLGSTTVKSGSVINATGKSNVSMHLAADTVMAGRINVDGTSMRLGTLNGIATLSNAQEPQYPYSSELVAAQNPILLGKEGVVAVGSGAADKQLSGGSVWFGADSLLTVNTALYEGSGLFQGDGSFTVEEGSQIHVDESTMGWGTYLISEGFETSDATGWRDHGHVTYSGDKEADLIVQKNENGDVVLTIGSNNIQDKLPDVAIPNLVNEVIADTNRSTQEAGVKGFLAGSIENGLLAQNLQSDTINSTAQIMAAGGVLVQGMTLVENMTDMTERHLSYEDVHFNNGKFQAWDGVRLWANALGQRVDGTDYDFTGGKTDIDGYNTGFIFGADLATNNGFRYGAAFAYQNANVDSNGSVVKTSNEADAYSFSLYGAKTFGLFNVIGTASYTRVDSDLEQSLPGQFASLHGKHTMDTSNDIWSVGVKGEMHVGLTESVALVPYVGVRAVSMKTDSDSSKMGGSEAFRYDTDTATQVQFPIGVALHANTELGGWSARGVLDVSVTPVAGDKDVDTTITAFGLNARDVTTTEFSDDVTGAIRIGGSAEKDNFSFGGNVGVSTGGSRDANVTFGLNARYRF